MQLMARCRKCGRVMKSERIDHYRVKMTCSCGFSDFRTITEKVKTVNPFYHKASFTPFMESEKGKMVLTMQKANREHLEIVSLEEISMLVSSDFELPQVLQQMAEKVADQLKVSVCSIYLTEGDELVLAATYGFDASFVGKIRIRSVRGLPVPWPAKCSISRSVVLLRIPATKAFPNCRRRSTIPCSPSPSPTKKTSTALSI